MLMHAFGWLVVLLRLSLLLLSCLWLVVLLLVLFLPSCDCGCHYDV